MPLYEYECGKCGTRTERIEKFEGPALKKCPKCGGKVHRLLSAPAVQFKGSGWYVTDYGRKTSGGDSAPSGEKSETKDSSEKGDKKDAPKDGAKAAAKETSKASPAKTKK